MLFLGRVFVIAAMCFCGADAAWANVMTFANFSGGQWIEDGITATPINPNPLYTSFADLADGGFDGSVYSITFTMASRFNAIQLDVYGGLNNVLDVYDYEFADGTSDYFYKTLEFNNVYISGNAPQAQVEFYAGSVPHTHILGPAFSNLDELTISINGPPALDSRTTLPDGGTLVHQIFCDSSPCSEFGVTSVTLTPVPIPAALPALGSGLGLLGGLGLWRRKRRARRSDRAGIEVHTA